MQKRISYFDVYWNRAEQSGFIRLTFDDREFETLEPLALTEFSALCTLLRAEKPVYYDAETQSLSTLSAPVG